MIHLLLCCSHFDHKLPHRCFDLVSGSKPSESFPYYSFLKPVCAILVSWTLSLKTTDISYTHDVAQNIRFYDFTEIILWPLDYDTV